MNFLAHALMASRKPGANSRYVLGAVLPDLASMADLCFDRALLPDHVAAGVSNHRAADRAFHTDPGFLRNSAALRVAALGAGLPVGASRAIGHVGWELLLDGELLDSTDVAERFGEALDQAPSAAAGFALVGRPQWTALARDLATRRWWLHYDEPSFVAERLFGILSKRTRLAFSKVAVDRVVAVLESAAPTTATEAQPLLERVLRATTENATPPPQPTRPL